MTLMQTFNTGLKCLIITIILVGCSNSAPESPDAKVRQTLQKLEEAAEARSLKEFMRHISPNYTDHRGDTWADIQRLVQFEYIKNQNIHIFSDITSLIIEGDTATVEINVAMAARASELESNSSRLRADTHRFSVLLKPSESRNEWLVHSVAWQRGWQ